jgi:hypothetical protein
MDSKTKNKLIFSGKIIGLLGVLYIIFRKKPTEWNDPFGWEKFKKELDQQKKQ